MEKIKGNYLLYVILGIIFLIVITSVFKAEKNHRDKLHKVVEEKIYQAAKECFLEEKCINQTTLEELYEKEYLKSEVINPVTKEIMSKDTCLEYKNEKVMFCR